MDEIITMDKTEARQKTEAIKSSLSTARSLLLEMYEREGWRALGYESWREYGQAEFGYSERRIYQLMDAAKVERNLCTKVQKPIPERRLRPLSKLEPDEQREAWQKANDNTGGNPTGADVEKAVEEIKPYETTKRLHQSNSNEWYTPLKYIEAARAVMDGIDTDPASSEQAQKQIRARTYYTEADDGLTQEWNGRIWLNPPYGGKSGPFVEKLFAEIGAGRVTEAVVLVNANSTETNWFAPLWNHTLCFTDHRIDFISPAGEKKNQSTHGSVFIYTGPNTHAFYRHFEKWGYVVKRVKHDN